MNTDERLGRAKVFAASKHHGHEHAERPYTAHLSDVEEALLRCELEPLFAPYRDILRIGAWLHDTLEDTDTSFDEIVREFGAEAAALVFAVTNEPGETRSERMANTYPKIRRHPYAIVLKLADRIANVEVSLQTAATGDGRMLELYSSEWNSFRRALQGDGCREMWSHLTAMFEDRTYLKATVLPELQREVPDKELDVQRCITILDRIITV